jgi:hypothetical protein
LCAWEHPVGDQLFDLGADGLKVEAVAAQYAGCRVVALEEQAEE